MSDAVELLPKDRVVIELLETIMADEEVVARCRALKSLGFTLALDDHVYSPSFHPIYATGRYRQARRAADLSAEELPGAGRASCATGR